MEEIDITDFYPRYPYLNDDTINPSSDNFFKNIFQLKEFYENKLDKIQENIQSGSGELFKQQKNISRFLAGYTPYNGILLFHDMGVGKTCAAVATVERLIENFYGNIKNILVITKSGILVDNFRKEIAEQCTHNKYIVNWLEDEEVTDRKKKSRLKKQMERFYEFTTYEKLNTQLKKNIKLFTERYEHSAIIIDEVHNIKKDAVSDIYNNLLTFLQTIKHKKIILLSGTPMKDRITEIGDIFNLILPPNNQFKNFEEEYTEKIDNIPRLKESKYSDFKDKIKGISSFVSMRTTIKKNFIGEHIPGIDFEFKKIATANMQLGGKQNGIYLDIKTGQTLEEDEKESSFHQEAINCSLGVFPDNSFGNKGYEKYLGEYSEKNLKIDDIGNKIRKYIEMGDKMEQLKSLSIKYYNIIKSIQDNKDKNIFIYCGHHVKQSGAIYLTKLIELITGHHVVTQKTKNTVLKTKKKRCILLTSTSSAHNTDFIKIFNDPKNTNGEYVNIIIGTEIISEGVSFKNIQVIHVVEPWWNFSETDQAIARAIRATSHNDLIKTNKEFSEKRQVDIYLHSATPVDEDDKPIYDQSIDYIMYARSAIKDRSIKKVERLIKESSFDCGFNYKRNYNIDYGDLSRECDYENCKFICDGLGDPDCNESGCEYSLDKSNINFGNFNIYYSDSIIKKLEKLIINDLNQIYTKMSDIDSIITKYYNDYSSYQILTAISNIINNNYKIKNNYGIQGFLNEFKNNFYMTSNIVQNSDNLLELYTKFPVISEDNDFYQFLQNNIEDIIVETSETTLEVDTKDLSVKNNFIDMLFDDEIKYYKIKGINIRNGNKYDGIRRMQSLSEKIGYVLTRNVSCDIKGININKVPKGINVTSIKSDELLDMARDLQIDIPQKTNNKYLQNEIIDKVSLVFTESKAEDHDNMRKQCMSKINEYFTKFISENIELNDILRVNYMELKKIKCKISEAKRGRPDIKESDYDTIRDNFKMWLTTTQNNIFTILKDKGVVDSDGYIQNPEKFDQFILFAYFKVYITKDMLISD